MATSSRVLSARIALGLLAASGCGLVIAVSQAFACTSLATLALTPNVAATGTPVQAAAAQFWPSGSQITFRWNSRSGPVLGSVAPDAKGAATITFVVPTVAPGYYVVIAQQTVTNIPQGGSAIATTEFTVPGTALGGESSGDAGAGQTDGSAPAPSTSTVQPAPRTSSGAGVPIASASAPGREIAVSPSAPAPRDTTGVEPASGFRGDFVLGATAQQVNPTQSHPSQAPTASTSPAGVVALLAAAGVLGVIAVGCGGALALRSRWVPTRVRRGAGGKRSR